MAINEMRLGFTVTAILLSLFAGSPAFGGTDSVRENNLPIPTLAPLVRRILPSVVAIRAMKSPPGGPITIDPSGGFPDAPLPARKNMVGSGIIVSSDGLVVTCNHVIEGADTVTATLSDGRNFDANVLAVDKDADLAVLRIAATGLAAVTIDDADDLQPGDFVVTLGNALGLGQSVSFGVVSALHRSYGEIRQADLIEIDASLRPGNSGGPLVDLRGDLIGVNMARSDETGSERGFGFAVPVSRLRSILLNLQKSG
ncbi:MAG TPA: trypsin-like peptidase domain-containing protein [Bradyrhizobium sp.]|nr:trypsin-like peptidase domain-containing protein [Bradyrhizobium sp.]